MAGKDEDKEKEKKIEKVDGKQPLTVTLTEENVAEGMRLFVENVLVPLVNGGQQMWERFQGYSPTIQAIIMILSIAVAAIVIVLHVIFQGGFQLHKSDS